MAALTRKDIRWFNQGLSNVSYEIEIVHDEHPTNQTEAAMADIQSAIKHLKELSRKRTTLAR